MAKKKKQPDFLDEVNRNISNFHREIDAQMGQLHKDISEATGTMPKKSYNEGGEVNSPLSTSQRNILITEIAKGKCEYPSCNVEAYLDVHHITPRNEGGSNKYTNLIVLCPNHHRMAGKGAIPRDQLRMIVRNRKKLE